VVTMAVPKLRSCVPSALNLGGMVAAPPGCCPRSGPGWSYRITARLHEIKFRRRPMVHASIAVSYGLSPRSH
jgi:hypothetical protein